jgi:hypothetical protein
MDVEYAAGGEEEVEVEEVDGKSAKGTSEAEHMEAGYSDEEWGEEEIGVEESGEQQTASLAEVVPYHPAIFMAVTSSFDSSKLRLSELDRVGAVGVCCYEYITDGDEVGVDTAAHLSLRVASSFPQLAAERVMLQRAMERADKMLDGSVARSEIAGSLGAAELARAMQNQEEQQVGSFGAMGVACGGRTYFTRWLSP